MERLVVATGNPGKAREIGHKLAGAFSPVLTLAQAGILDDIEEDGETFWDNARIKAAVVGERMRCAVLADDSGLVVEALGGAPGVRSARYAGDRHDDAENLALLLQNIQGYPMPRKAWFVCAIALWRPGKGLITAVGTCAGEIVDGPMGENGFGYDPVFFDPTLGKTFAQIPLEEKNAISHRARALDALKRMLGLGGEV